jgi:hypothetical protein
VQKRDIAVDDGVSKTCILGGHSDLFCQVNFCSRKWQRQKSFTQMDKDTWQPLRPLQTVRRRASAAVSAAVTFACAQSD